MGHQRSGAGGDTEESGGAGVTNLRMDIQIDLSVRIENLTVDSALALSNRTERAILIPARVKRRVSRQLTARGAKPKMIPIRMFAGALYLLIEPLLGELTTVVVDLEFEGWNGEIRGLLLALIHKAGHPLPGDAIEFRSVGKHARCHHLALATFRHRRQPHHRVTLAEFLKVS